jgi:broad specificity phosphatase PhoE
MTSYQTGCHIVLLRHGHRQEIPQGGFGHDLTLTEKGKKSSLRLGKKLADILWGEIHSSPLIRCQETAEHFLKGAGQKLSIHLSPLLGDPGPFVYDDAKAGPLFLANTPYEIMQKLLARKNLPGMRTIEEGGRLFDAYLKTVSRFPCLMISHDIIIALLYAYFSKSILQKFPDYLGGFCLNLDKRDNKSSHVL